MIEHGYRRRLAVSALFACLAPCLISAQAIAQGTSAPPPPVLTANARLVVVDVVVTDARGKPVDGLTQKDFSVSEDGKPQTIRSFEAGPAHELPAATLAEGAAAAFDPATPARFGQSPVDIFVLDQANTHFADSDFARRSLRSFLENQPVLLPHPATLLIVGDSHFKTAQGFTRDRDALLRSLDATRTAYPWKLELNGKAEYGPLERLDQSLRAIQEMTQAYALIPGRKNLIWIGGGFPTVDPTILSSPDAAEVKATLRHVANAMLSARIALYAVDPSSTAAGMTEIADSTQMDFLLAAGDGLGNNAGTFSATEDFDLLGPASGGQVIRGLNDVGQQIAHAVDLAGHYYTLSYTPSTSSTAKARFRAIKVACLRPELTAISRSGYYAESSGYHAESSEGDLDRDQAAAFDLSTAAEAAGPLHGLRVTVEPDGSAPDRYLIRVGASNLTWKPDMDGGASASVAILAVSLDAKRHMLGHALHGMVAHAKPGTDLTDAARMADFTFFAKRAPKASVLRFVVRDSATGRMGSFEIPRSDR